MANKTQADIQFQKKLNKAIYKTTYQSISSGKPKIPPEKNHGINGKFTDHLMYSGMVKNSSLNTTVDRDRWVNGNNDWMGYLG